MWSNSKTQNLTKLKNCKIARKLNTSSHENTHKLELWKLKKKSYRDKDINLNCDTTQKLKFEEEKNLTIK